MYKCLKILTCNLIKWNTASMYSQYISQYFSSLNFESLNLYSTAHSVRSICISIYQEISFVCCQEIFLFSTGQWRALKIAEMQMERWETTGNWLLRVKIHSYERHLICFSTWKALYACCCWRTRSASGGTAHTHAKDIHIDTAACRDWRSLHLPFMHDHVNIFILLGLGCHCLHFRWVCFLSCGKSRPRRLDESL